MPWCSFAAKSLIVGHPGISYIDVPWRIVWHSTEVDGRYKPRADGSYFGGASPPHFTVDAEQVWQHIDTSVSSYALVHNGGTVETNRARAIQIEVMGRAAEAPDWDPAVYANMARLARWLEETHRVPATTVDEFHFYPPENGIRLNGNEPWRFTPGDWLAFSGHCAHQHVPGNLHGDCGKLRLDLLFADEEKTDPTLPASPVHDYSEDTVKSTLIGTGTPNQFGVAAPRWNPGFGRPPVFVSAAPNGLVRLGSQIGAHVEGEEVVLDILMVDPAGIVIGPFDVHVSAA